MLTNHQSEYYESESVRIDNFKRVNKKEVMRNFHVIYYFNIRKGHIDGNGNFFHKLFGYKKDKRDVVLIKGELEKSIDLFFVIDKHEFEVGDYKAFIRYRSKDLSSNGNTFDGVIDSNTFVVRYIRN